MNPKKKLSHLFLLVFISPGVYGGFCPFEVNSKRYNGFKQEKYCFEMVHFPENKNFIDMRRRSWHEWGQKMCDKAMPNGRMHDFWFEDYPNSFFLDKSSLNRLKNNKRLLRGVRMVNAMLNWKGEVRFDLKFSNGTQFTKPFKRTNGWDLDPLKYAEHFSSNPGQPICSFVSYDHDGGVSLGTFPCVESARKVDATLCQGLGTDDKICRTFMNGKCQCAAGYSGDLCQDDGDSCVKGPCKNYAICEDYYKRYECICKAGYTGPRCETDIDECASNPCKNGGTCRQFEDYYNCTCPADYRGKHCDAVIGKCENVKCENGGTCEEIVNHYRCKCLFGYHGRHCEHVSNLCIMRPCKNNGECEGSASDFTCKCKAGFTGRRCEQQIEEKDNSGVLFSIGVIVAITLFLVAIISALAYKIVTRKKKKRGKVKPKASIWKTFRNTAKASSAYTFFSRTARTFSTRPFAFSRKAATTRKGATTHTTAPRVKTVVSSSIFSRLKWTKQRPSNETATEVTLRSKRHGAQDIHGRPNLMHP